MSAPPQKLDRAPVAGLFAAGALVHGAWALTVRLPEDWDAQYYLAVARSLAKGQGAVTRSLWNLSVLPERLPLPADLHWMPLPSRVLVPGLLLWPSHGHTLVTVLLAALWGPLAALLAADLGLSRRAAVGAGLLAATGGVYARLLSTPDSIAVYGVIGGAGLLAVARGSWAGAALLAALAALTRNDGFLLAPCLALGFRGPRAVAVAIAGPVATALWWLRNDRIAGDAFWEARRIAASSRSYLDLYDGRHDPITVPERLQLAAAAVPAVVEYWVTPGLLLLAPATAIAAWQARDRPWVRAFAAYLLVVPLVTVLLAPAIATHGTLYRSGAALMPAHLALAAAGLAWLAHAAAERRGYPPALLPALLGGAYALIAVGLGLTRAAEAVPVDCAALDAVPEAALVFSSDPLAVELACDRPGVMLTRTTGARAAEVADRYGVRWLLVADVDDEGSVRADDVPALLPGWERVDDRLYAAP